MPHKVEKHGDKMVSVHSFDESDIKKETKDVIENDNPLKKLSDKYARLACTVPEDLAIKWKLMGIDLYRTPASEIKKMLIREGRIDCINPRRKYI